MCKREREKEKDSKREREREARRKGEGEGDREKTLLFVSWSLQPYLLSYKPGRMLAVEMGKFRSASLELFRGFSCNSSDTQRAEGLPYLSLLLRLCWKEVPQMP